MDTATAAIVAASIGAGVALLIAFIGVNARIFDRLGKLERGFGMLRDDYQHLRADNRQLREEMRAEIRESNQQLRELIRSESEATRGEIRRLADALVSHHHEADGSIVFRIPPPQDAGD
ncbi:MAG: hypothetical protein F4X66_02940 [Chloroflexi bacterium]|nr:hypothetical protein [Chloroflexota bacterium]MYE39889.1 hypothetical protein [Chloroflexota bacterium]